MDAYCLVGQPGHKNGEKLLRTALVTCEEWRDAQSREAALRAALADGQPELAAILMAKDSSRLRKAQFIWLCRHWGYATRFWQRKKGGLESRGGPTPSASIGPGCNDDIIQPRRRRRADFGGADEALQLALTLPARAMFCGRDGALAALHGAVGPMVLAVARGWRAEIAEARFRAAAGANIDWTRVRSIRGALEMNAFLRDALELRREALQQYRLGLDEGDLRAAAYAVDTRLFTPEPELDALRAIADGGMMVTIANAARISERLGGCLPEAEQAYADSYRQGHAAMMVMIQALHSKVAQRRFGSSLAALLDEAEACLEMLIEYALVSRRALQARVEWLSELCILRGEAAGQRDILLAQPAALPSLFTLWPAGRSRNAPLLARTGDALHCA